MTLNSEYKDSNSDEYKFAEPEALDWLNNFLSDRDKKPREIKHEQKYNYGGKHSIELDRLGSGYAVEIYLAKKYCRCKDR
ncbi:hypothetical protein D3C74_377590 [compost metagenome]